MTIRVTNSLDPNQAWHFVGADIGPNCLQRSSADDSRRQRFEPNSNFLELFNALFYVQGCGNMITVGLHLCTL